MTWAHAGPELCPRCPPLLPIWLGPVSARAGLGTLRRVLLTAGPLWDCGRAQSPPQVSLAGHSHLSHWRGIEKRFGEAPFSFRVRYQPRSTGRPQGAPQFWPWSHLETKRWVHILKILMSPS